MTFYYDTPNGRHASHFPSLIGYHRDNLADPYVCVSTSNLPYAVYFLCDAYNRYVDLSAIYPSYGTDPDDARCLYNLKLQYVPESLI